MEFRDKGLWSEIRNRVLVDGISRRQIIRETGISMETIQKILNNPNPLWSKILKRNLSTFPFCRAVLRKNFISVLSKNSIGPKWLEFHAKLVIRHAQAIHNLSARRGRGIKRIVR